MLLPTGTLTFLFTDIEGSTRQWEKFPDPMRRAVTRHDELLRQAIEGQQGVVFKTVGDAFCAVFPAAPAALTAAFLAQQAVQSEPWPVPITLRVRMALHTGVADERDADYFGPPVNRVARLRDLAAGGQTLLSKAAYELARDFLPPGITLRDLGPHRMKDLARPEEVYQLSHPFLPDHFAPLKSLENLPNNLPQQLTSFIGREKEMNEIKELLHKSRLLTLTGAGGCGKTRLSLQVAADVLDEYPDGVWFVELAPLTEPALVPLTVASVLGIKEQAGTDLARTLAEAVKHKSLLLVLDNCEHLLPACARLADLLLRQGARLRILASSREMLGIAGERPYRVPSLSQPDPRQPQTPESLSQYEAVQLFIERALVHQPAFAVTNQNAAAVASVCQRLDGIPMAVELAAARIRSLSVEEINARLDNRFRLLTGGSKTVLPRQQTLRALIDWSYDLLTGPEKLLLRRLAVFAGGWTLALAESVCTGDDIEEWEVLDLLTSLGDKSLLAYHATASDAPGGAARYRLLDTVRQYAQDRLRESGEESALRDRHLAALLAFAEDAGNRLVGADQREWFARFEAEHDNLRTALEWCRAGNCGAKTYLRLVVSQGRFWDTCGYLQEGKDHQALVIAQTQSGASHALRGVVLIQRGWLVSLYQDHTEAHACYQEALALWRKEGTSSDIRHALGMCALADEALEQWESARAQMEEILAMARAAGESPSGVLVASLARLAQKQGDKMEARRLSAESLAILRAESDLTNLSRTLETHARLDWEDGDRAAAWAALRESLTLSRDLGDKVPSLSALWLLGEFAWEEGGTALAVQVWGAVAAQRAALGLPHQVRESFYRAERRVLGDAAFDAAWAAGQVMTWENALEFALAG